jgi:hypothetical protein
LQTNQLDVCHGHYVDITAEIWVDVIDLLDVIEVTRREEMTSPVPLPLDARAISPPDNQSALSQVNEQDSKKKKRKNKNKNKIEQGNSYAPLIFYECISTEVEIT